MQLKKETKWLCENAKSLERFSGQWILFDPSEGLVGKGASLNRLLRNLRRRAAGKRFVFHVPSRRDLARPLFNVKKR